VSKWEFQPDAKEKANELYIRRVDGASLAREPTTSKIIAKTPLMTFELMYNSQTRLCGYKLTYDLPKLQSKFTTFNSCFLAFSTPQQIEPKLEIVYEDQAVRLLTYEFPTVADLWLIGRWRE